MSKIVLSSIADLTQSTTAQTTINANSTIVQTAFDNTLSRDGTFPNQMGSNLDMNSNQILNLPAPVSGTSPARLVDVITNPTLVLTIPPVGTSGATVPLLNAANTWSATQTTTARTIINYTPVFDLASGLFSVATLFTNLSISVPTGATYSSLRFTDVNGTSPTYTLAATTVGCDIYASPIIGASSNVSSSGYGAVLQITNAGPGTAKGIHGGCFGSGTSTGVIIGINLQLQPVATQGYTSGAFCSLTSSGINGKAIGYGIESTGDQYLHGMANVVGALPISGDYIRWWQASSSAAGANFLNLLATDGTTSLFKVTKAGAVSSLSYSSSGFGVDSSGNISGVAIAGSGAITSGTSFKVSVNQVVGPRVTGYTAMTGSPDKATAYATSSVTLAQLAGRVAQLQADLTSHGLIGT